MAKGFYQYYKDLPSWAKGVVVVGGGVVAYLAVTRIMRKIKQAKETAMSMQEVDSANSELQTEIRNGKKPTINNTTQPSLYLSYNNVYKIVQVWATIGDCMENRTGKQCRERWHNQLNPVINKSPWSAEEQEIFKWAHEVIYYTYFA